MKTLLLTTLLSTLLFAGCASQPKSFGDQLSNRGNEANSIGKQWNNSSDGVAKGEKMMTKGQNMIETSKSDQLKGEQMIEEGRRQVETSKQEMLNSEADYQKMRQTPIAAPVAK
ncbi:hypothetical protein FK216_02570 [Moraxellaceae bacterium AER2_44_116]|jgi:outer membrane murein-binding lipoprotein Lpp|nr:hypothetical protein [Moraxellaceae bacterium]TQC99144.1 hypothetical protein FK216_02570 [Moraxellaceae bacterium AER2_44_116]